MVSMALKHNYIRLNGFLQLEEDYWYSIPVFKASFFLSFYFQILKNFDNYSFLIALEKSYL